MGMIYLTNNDNKYEGVINLPLLATVYNTLEIDLNLFDAIIVTSKNAIKALNNSSKEWHKKPIYSISKPTSDYIISLNGNVVYTGISGHGNDFANELIPILHNKKVLYLKAAEVVSNLEDILKQNGIDLASYIAYETVCQSVNTKIESNSIIIFTSPSNIDCFLKNFSWDSTNMAVCIGKTTALRLPEYIKYHISSKTSIDECIKLAKNLL
jgi:uroporphyrinogen-III synthase